MIHRFFLSVLCCIAITCCGCGEPSLYPITGKVTLAGKPYERLLVYFHPIDREASKHTLGVGETAADGALTLRSTAGNGLATGSYRVSFSCYVVQGTKGQTVGLSDEKADDDRKLVTKDIVPLPYGSPTESPVEFEVKSSPANFFEFDIPSP